MNLPRTTVRASLLKAFAQIAVLAASASLTACERSERSPAPAAQGSESAWSSPAPAPYVLPPVGYSQQSPQGLTFHGYDCTQNCSGHEAGYEWAERKGIDDEDDCTGKSNSFIEGCIAYVKEQNGEGEDSDEDEE